MDTFIAVTKLKKLFSEREGESTPLKEKDMNVYHDRMMVICLMPKTQRMKEIFEAHFDKTMKMETGGVIKNLTYVPEKKEKKEEVRTKYATDYLLKILELLKAFNNDDSITLKMRKDYPIWVETDEFVIVLAPRVED